MKGVTLKDVRVNGEDVAKGVVIDEPAETIAALKRAKGISCDKDKIKKAESEAKKSGTDKKTTQSD